MRTTSWVVLAGVLTVAGLGAAEGRVGVEVRGNVLVAQTAEDAAGAQITITGPDNLVLQRTFAPGEAAALSLAGPDGARLADGQYSYEVAWSPLQKAQRGPDELAGAEPPAAGGGLTASGTFRVTDGLAALPAAIPEPKRAQAAAPGAPDTVFTDDLCVGFGCPVAPTFGDTDILIMEDNTRLKFDDTSTAAGFANRDWSLVANDLGSGGANRLFIQDCGVSSMGGCTGNVLLSLAAGAPANSVFVDSSGRVGFRTGAPVLDLHVNTGNTPALRLEQNNSGGFTAQTWDIAGNEANFFVRDVTGGSRLPFRLRPGAPTSSIDVAASGNVGVGTASPSTSLHVRRADGTAKLLVEEATTTAGSRNMLQIINNGASTFRFDNTSSAVNWGFGSTGSNNFFITPVGSAAFAMSLTQAGNMTINGTLTQGSDRNAKDDISAVDPVELLAKVSELPIASWRYKGDDATHVGPMAQDFYAAFGLGADDKHIAPGDMAAVALAAVQALRAEVAQKDALLKDQAAQLKALAERLEQLERR